MILLVFFMLLVLGIAFYSAVMKGVIGRQQTEASQLEAIGVAQRISFLPELQCSEQNSISEGCIDMLKLEASKDLMSNNSLYYFSEFGRSTISVREIYPLEREWQLYNNTPKSSQKLSTSIPVLIKDPAIKKPTYYFGVMTVDVYVG